MRIPPGRHAWPQTETASGAAHQTPTSSLGLKLLWSRRKGAKRLSYRNFCQTVFSWCKSWTNAIIHMTISLPSFWYIHLHLISTVLSPHHPHLQCTHTHFHTAMPASVAAWLRSAAWHLAWEPWRYIWIPMSTTPPAVVTTSSCRI